MKEANRRPLIAGVAFAFSLAAIGETRAGITTQLVTIGGPGAFGSEGPADPPTLSNGTPAGGTALYSYDDSTGVLTLTVTNTSPVTVGVPNPLVSQIYVNLPHLAVTGVALISQVNSGGGGPPMVLLVDTDLQTSPNPLGADGLGSYGVLLKTTGGLHGAIANAAADTTSAPPGSYVIGPVTFTLDITGPGEGFLTAGAFAGSFSAIPPGSHRANSAMRFGAGGFTGGGAYISNAPGGGAGAWAIGVPAVGQEVDFVMNGTPAAIGCVVTSLDPGPIMVGNLTIPIGMPMFPVIVGVVPPSTTIVQEVLIPAVPGLPGTTFFFATALFTSPPPMITVGDPFSMTILP